MQKAMLQAIVALLASVLTKENLKLVADAMLDVVEDIVQKTDNSIDDKLVLPAVQRIREAFDIPDNDLPAEGS